MMDRLSLVALVGGLLLLSTSCSDPTGVGSDLVGAEDEGAPKVYEVVADSFATTISTPPTGRVLIPGGVGGGSNQSWRFLAGTVNDPIVGVIEAEGYVDFLGAASRTESFSTAPVDSLDAELRLDPTYLHGDTISTYEVNLFELQSEADMSRAPSDTSFDVRRQLGSTVSVSGRQLTDSLVTLPLPEAWISDHIDAIRSDSFGTDVNGFKITAANEPSSTDRQVVAGFDHNEATLRVTTSSDTVDFQALKSFTHVERRGTPEDPPEDRRLLLDGVGQTLQMEWDYSRPIFTDTLANTPMNQAEITTPVDTVAMATSLAGEPSFVRPEVNGYRILARRAEGAPTCSRLGLPRAPSDESSCILPTNTSAAPGAARITSQVSFTIFDRVLFETPLFTTFQVEIATRASANTPPENTFARGLPSTLPALIRTDTTLSAENLPRATLVVTPL